VALALYRKYRPATFAEVVGQEHVTDPLRTALAAGRINHAYLFSGPRGCGKTSSARILARSLNCVQGPTPDPCGVCASCVALAPEGPGSLDVVELDAASHGGVDDTRDLRDKAFYMPAESRFRVFIIDEAHMVTPQGFNALLKIVEEPPEHLVFVFATTEPEKVLPTIRSRTHHYPFRLLPPAVLRSLLERLAAEEGVTVEPAVFPLVVKAGGGSARDALSVLDQLFAGAGPDGITYAHAVALLGVTDAALLDEMVDALAASDGASVFGVLDKVSEAGHDPRRFGADLLQRLRDLVILQAVPEAATKGLIDTPEDQLAAMTAQADRLPAGTVTRYAEILHTGLTDMRGTTSPRLVLELLSARMLLPAASTEDGALLQRLERLERRLSIASEQDPGDGAAAGAGRRVEPGATRPAGARSTTAEGGVAQGAVPQGAAGQGAVGQGAAGQGAAGQPGAAPAAAPQPGAARTPSRRAAAPTTEPPAVAPRSGGLDLPSPPTLSSTSRSGSSSAARDSPVAAAGASRSAASPPARPDGVVAASGATDPGADAATERTDAAGLGTVDVTDVRRLWPEVLEAVKRQRRTTQILLEQATVSTLSGRTLRLAMPTTGLARKVEEAGNADVLRAALREILGVDWTIRCETGADGGASADPGRRPEPAAASTASRDSGTGRGTITASARRPAPPAAPAPAGPPDEDDIPDDYDDLDPGRSGGAVIDPEQAAIELLAAELGARPLDGDS
jgi:DNA polymerase-3 subunit gamma/tau